MALLLAGILWFALAAGAAVASRPNVVMIVSDDQAYEDFGFMGNAHVQTPNIDRLASRSARYIHGYVPTSVCRPSLVTLLTGLYPHQHKVWYNHSPPGNSAFNKMTSVEEYVRTRSPSFEAIQRVPTLPRELAKLGYRSLQTGKYWEGHYSTAGFTEGMTVFKASEAPAYGNRKLASGDLVAHGNGDAGLKIGRDTMQPIYSFIDDCVAKEDPFFVWYAPFLPHTPHDSPERFREIYRKNPDVPKHLVPYYASCSQFDETVGDLVEFVERKGLARDTIFVFVIDNGWRPTEERNKRAKDEFQVDHRTKRSPFDYGLRTPMLIRWDGQVKPATFEQLCNSIDLVPSILSAVGVEPIAGLPGVDLMPSARGEEPLEDRAVFGEIYPGDATTLDDPSADIAYRWVREGDYKLVIPHPQQGGVWQGKLYGAKPALYNVVKDPHERKNLIDLAGQQNRVEHLQTLLDAWWTP